MPDDPTPLATAADVKGALLRDLTTDESANMDWVIKQASARLRQRMPTIDQRIAYWTADHTDRRGIDPTVVAGVLAGAIRRAVLRANGATTSSETTGPFSRSFTFDDRMAGETLGVLAITDGDLKQLTGVARNRPRTARLAPGMLERYR